MSTCIFPGKFQPFHTGHLLVVKGMMQACSQTVVVICHDPDDAGMDDIMTNEQVREAISAALLAEDIVDANIAVVSDCKGDDEWVDKILEAAGNPEDAAVWSGNDHVLGIFESHNIETKKITHVPGIDGEEIRGMIKEKDGTWRTKVPKGALDVVEKAIAE
jgi:nicotinamide-nucleotide adenylyltransferase